MRPVKDKPIRLGGSGGIQIDEVGVTHTTGRDKQIETATRLQLIQVVKEWRGSNMSVDQLLFRLQTTHIEMPNSMIKRIRGTDDER